MNIVIVEDEGITALFLQETVEGLGHDVLGVFSEAESLIETLKTQSDVDLILMDIKIKGKIDGIELAYSISLEYPEISIAFITSFKDTKTIKSAKDALPIGYLIKPVLESDIEALLMVAESCQKSHKINNTSIINIGKYIYNKLDKSIYLNNKIIELSQKETICIDILAKNKNSNVTFEKLITNIWGKENNREVSLRELVYRLRKKLPDIDIKNISKRGYVLKD